MIGTEQNPKQLSYLIDIVRQETKTPKYSFIKLQSVTSGAKFNKNCKSPFWDTSDVFVYVNKQKYSITKRTIKGFPIRSTCGMQWPVDFQFDKIEKRITNKIDISKYCTNKSYKDYDRGGSYSNESLYLKDGIYYAYISPRI